MSEITRVALDAMGGDNAPREIVKGAVEAVRKRKDIKVLLTGKEDVIRKNSPLIRILRSRLRL